MSSVASISQKMFLPTDHMYMINGKHFERITVWNIYQIQILNFKWPYFESMHLKRLLQ